jgi:23S rRNA (adenine2030-N6)-methyltransferase
MNYSHAFHAGNFADIVKHAALLAVLGRMQAGATSLQVIDTHGGRGLYDLSASEARRSAEAERGVARLMAAEALPAPVLVLREAVRQLDPGPGVRLYPGSPRLIADRLRTQDRLTVFELNPREASSLHSVLKGRAGVEVREADGFEGAPALAVGEGARLILIDPPFERGDDYARSAGALRQILAQRADATVMIWLPLKDLETFDAFLREVGPAGPVLVAEARLRPLRDPLRMNGCALVIASPPAGTASDLQAICSWTVETLGEGGEARVWTSAC